MQPENGSPSFTVSLKLSVIPTILGVLGGIAAGIFGAGLIFQQLKDRIKQDENQLETAIKEINTLKSHLVTLGKDQHSDQQALIQLIHGSVPKGPIWLACTDILIRMQSMTLA
jgi:ribosomal protein S15P/S13E